MAAVALVAAVVFIVAPLPAQLLDYRPVTSVRLLDREGTSLWLTLARGRLNYEIHNQDDQHQRGAARR